MKKIITQLKLKEVKASVCIALIWILFFIADCIWHLLPLLCGKGLAIIGQDYYRLFTGVLLHGNVWHLLVNVTGIYWIGYYLERRLGSCKFLLSSLIALLLGQIAFYAVRRYTPCEFGGSFLTFACIGILVSLLLFQKNGTKFRLGTWYGNWILIYALAGNVPVFSFMSISTVILHAVCFAVGFLCGLVEIKVLKVI